MRRSLLWSSNLWAMGEGILSAMLAVITQKAGGSILDITSAFAAYLFAAGLFQIAAGSWLENKNRTTIISIMLTGYALNALSVFMFLFAQSPLHVLLIQVTLGFAYALANPSWNMLYAEDSTTYHWARAGGDAQMVRRGTKKGGHKAPFALLAAFEITLVLLQQQCQSGSLHREQTWYQLRLQWC